MLMKLRQGMRRTENQKGFTLVELMVVVVILGILVAIAVPIYNAQTAKANHSAVASNLRIIDGAIAQYLIGEPADAPDADNLKGYLQAWPTKPSGAEYSVTGSGTTASPYMGQVEIEKMNGIADGTYTSATLPEYQ